MTTLNAAPVGENAEASTFLPVPFEQFPGSHAPSRRTALAPFIACTVGRMINVHADEEFFEMRCYQRELGRANDGYIEHEDGTEEPRYDFDNYHSTMVRPNQVHVSHLYAADVGEIVLRNFADDHGRIHKPKQVARSMMRFTKKYNTLSRRHNEIVQDELLMNKGIIPKGPRRTLGEDVLDDDNMRMINGIFELSDMLGSFGRGNAFGLSFAPEARRFLQAERARALDMFVDTLGIKRLDNDIEDQIMGSEQHVTLIRLGLRQPIYEVVLPPKKEDLLPRTFVTDFDPKARAIIPRGND